MPYFYQREDPSPTHSTQMKTALFITKAVLLAGVVIAANPRVGATQDGGFYVVSCSTQTAAAVGLNGFRASSIAGNPFGAFAMKVFGCN